MIPEARFRCAPMRHRVAVRLVGSLKLRFVPILLERRVALEVESLLVRFTKTRIENKLRSSTGIADALRLRECHVIGNAVFRLASCEALQESRSAVLDPIQNGPVELRGVCDRDLPDEGRSMAGQKSFGNCFFLDVLALRGGAKHVHV